MTNFKYIYQLKKGLNKKSGRNFRGKITVYHKGGGHKNLYRIIDFNYSNNVGIVKKIEYDPNRTCDIALLLNPENNTYFYQIAPVDLMQNTVIHNFKDDKKKERRIQVGDSMQLFNIPINIPISNIELFPGSGSSLVRSAGNMAYIIKKDKNINGFAYIKLSNKRIKKLSLTCTAMIGRVSNKYHNLINYRKAGTMRNLNIRPTVRGVAMNPIDHPMGGGEGKSSGGRVSVTPWGKITKGKKTVKNKKHV
jgi:large subunit ribosomal protein L2